MAKNVDQPKIGGSPLGTPKHIAAKKRAYAEKFGRAQDGAFRNGAAVADINPENKDDA